MAGRFEHFWSREVDTDEKRCEWGKLFDSPRAEVTSRMASKAQAYGCVQREAGDVLTWEGGNGIEVAFFIIDDPSDLGLVRRAYGVVAALQPPVGFLIVRQPAGSDPRGGILFDIFRVSSESYLWHDARVCIARSAGGGESVT
jgi:hypothetical protein